MYSTQDLCGTARAALSRAPIRSSLITGTAGRLKHLLCTRFIQKSLQTGRGLIGRSGSLMKTALRESGARAFLRWEYHPGKLNGLPGIIRSTGMSDIRWICSEKSLMLKDPLKKQGSILLPAEPMKQGSAVKRPGIFTWLRDIPITEDAFSIRP